MKKLNLVDIVRGLIVLNATALITAIITLISL